MDDTDFDVEEGSYPKHSIYLRKTTGNRPKRKFPVDCDDVICKYFSQFNLPGYLINHYRTKEKPIKKFHEWQEKLFRDKRWKERKNCVIVIPTGGGKTTVAEVAFAQSLVMDQDSKNFFLSPYIALASEQVTTFSSAFVKQRVVGCYGEKSPIIRGASICVCTYEKMHSILQESIRCGTLSKIKNIVIDEVHLINHSERGPVIELLLTKLLLISEKVDIRLILLTATMNRSDSIEISNWIGGFLYYSESRLSSLKYVYYCNNYFYDVEESNSQGRLILDKNGFKQGDTNARDSYEAIYVRPILNMVKRSDNSVTLIFCMSKTNSGKLAMELKNVIDSDPLVDTEMLRKRERFVEINDTRNQDLNVLIKSGVAYHNSSLLESERKMIEKAINSSLINIVIATTTLSAGVNIKNLNNVIIFEDSISKSNSLISKADFVQMVGRAGREEGKTGYVCIFSSKPVSKKEDVLFSIKETSRYIKSPFEAVTSKIRRSSHVEKCFLECIHYNILQKSENLETFLSKTFDYYHCKSFNMEDQVKNSLLYLQSKDLIYDNNTLTEIGKLYSQLSFKIEETEELISSLSTFGSKFHHNDDLTILYSLVSPRLIQSFTKTSSNFDDNRWNKMFDRYNDDIERLTGINYQTFQSLPVYNNQDSKEKMIKFLVATLLLGIINEASYRELSKLYGRDIGEIDDIRKDTVYFYHQTSRLCNLRELDSLSLLFLRFSLRFAHSAKEELTSLLFLDSVSTVRIARLMYSNNIKTVQDLTSTTTSDLNNILNDKKLSERITKEVAALSSSLKLLEPMI